MWESVAIHSGLSLSISSGEVYTYNFLIDSWKLNHILLEETYSSENSIYDDYHTNTVIQLNFKNARLSILNMELYNPTFTGFWTPYQNIDYQFLGFNTPPSIMGV
jgi:hypothetical protein